MSKAKHNLGSTQQAQGENFLKGMMSHKRQSFPVLYARQSLDNNSESEIAFEYTKNPNKKNKHESTITSNVRDELRMSGGSSNLDVYHGIAQFGRKMARGPEFMHILKHRQSQESVPQVMASIDQTDVESNMVRSSTDSLNQPVDL